MHNWMHEVLFSIFQKHLLKNENSSHVFLSGVPVKRAKSLWWRTRDKFYPAVLEPSADCSKTITVVLSINFFDFQTSLECLQNTVFCNLRKVTWCLKTYILHTDLKEMKFSWDRYSIRNFRWDLVQSHKWLCTQSHLTFPLYVLYMRKFSFLFPQCGTSSCPKEKP